MLLVPALLMASVPTRLIMAPMMTLTMPLPLWKEGKLDNKPFAHKDCYLHGSQKGMVRDTVTMTDDEKREVTRDYYAEIELMDHQLGRLLDYLEESGLRNAAKRDGAQVLPPFRDVQH